MLSLATVVTRLRDTCPSFRLVAGAAEVAAARNGVPAAPAAYVIPLGESSADNQVAGSHAVMQRVEHVFGVLIATRNATDGRGQAGVDDLDALKAEVRSALLGWQSDDALDPILFGGGQLVGFFDGFVWWQEEFATAYYLRQVQ